MGFTGEVLSEFYGHSYALFVSGCAFLGFPVDPRSRCTCSSALNNPEPNTQAITVRVDLEKVMQGAMRDCTSFIFNWRGRGVGLRVLGQGQ